MIHIKYWYYFADEPDLTPDSITPVSSGEISTCKDWLQTKLTKEISRGKKLQNIKKIIKPQQPNELFVLNSKSRTNKSKIKRPDVKVKTDKDNRSSVSTDGNYNNKKKNKIYRQCTGRIMELAAPTKRQCIATWRNRSDKLPPLMVNEKYFILQ